MAKCDICGKGVTFGIKVSHSHRRANKAWKPNVRRVKAIVDGTPTKVYACTRCLRSGKVNRAVQSFLFICILSYDSKEPERIAQALFIIYDIYRLCP